MKLIVLYGPCDDNLFNVLHAIHRVTSAKISTRRQSFNRSEMDQAKPIPHLRHDLKNVCQWISHNTQGLVAITSSNASWSEVLQAANQYNLPSLTSSESCSCIDRKVQSSTSELLERAAFDYLVETELHDAMIVTENGSQSGLLLTSLFSEASKRVSYLEITAGDIALNSIEMYLDQWNSADFRGDGCRLISLGNGEVIETALSKLLLSGVYNKTKLMIRGSPFKWQQILRKLTAFEVDLLLISEERFTPGECPVAIEVMPTGWHSNLSENTCSSLSAKRNAEGRRTLIEIQNSLKSCCAVFANDEFVIWRSFPSGKGVQLLQPVAVWSSMGLLRTELLEFEETTLRVAVMEYPPYVILKRTENDEVLLNDCVLSEMLEFLSKKLHFRIKLVSPRKKEWGIKINGTWYGAIGMLNKGEADIVPFLTLTPLRREAVVFSNAVISVYYGILVKAPSEPPRTYIFLRPYTREVWMSTFLLAIMMSLVLFKIHCLSMNFSGESYKCGLTKYRNCLWCIFSGMVQQSEIHLPRTVSARLLLSTWWLAVLVIVATYSANLIAFLAFPESKWLIQSLEDLVNNERMMLMIDEGCPVLEDFKKSNQEVYRMIREKYLDVPTRGLIVSSTDLDIADLVATGKLVYIDDVNHLTQIIDADYKNTGKCRVTVAPDRFSKMDVSLGFRKGSYLAPIFNDLIQEMWESGILSYWKSQYSPKRDECLFMKTAVQSGYSEVDLDDVEGAFNLLLLGFAASVALLSCEVVKHRISGFMAADRPA